jgi:DNA-binding MarR family transcriptional regulator
VSGVRKALELPFDPIDRAARIWEHRFGPSSAMAAVTSIMRAQQILLAELDAILRPYGLTFARYEALVLLSFSRAGALPLRVIGERLMVHPTSVTNTIDRLEAQGMVVRRPNPVDGRGRLAEITERGRDAVRAATRDLMNAEFGMGEYTERERADLFGLLRGLRLTAGDFIADLAGYGPGRPCQAAVEGHPDLVPRGVRWQRHALGVGRHADVAEPAGRRVRLARRLPLRAARREHVEPVHGREHQRAARRRGERCGNAGIGQAPPGGHWLLCPGRAVA